ncbi:hypothetical protein MAPG_09148 [Magnaporthiopsis poae ATCC 64411]|uniref:Uncharacterized protein n=1 Tax=Magnaporthiopsis poae (strain ATCC 64411 / 73-15) TaxID=644358 RepID=A0A0C4E969_MAGP6|nr:hypothetical protein MAPG_09148 [Magnaporthiopsis poae ATCC 64411]
MNALRLSTGPRRILAEIPRAAYTSQRRALHADAPFLFSLPSDPEASMARTAAAHHKPQHATPAAHDSASSSAQQRAQTTSQMPQRPGAHPDAPYILSVPPEFDHVPSSGGAARGGEQMRA